MADSPSFLELEEVDEITFKSLYDQIISEDSNEELGKIAPPDTEMKARDWAMAYLKLDDQITRYEKEYIPALTERYIKPVKDKIEKHKIAQEMIKDGLFEFLEKVEETKVTFPDICTVYQQKGRDSFIYPEDEKAFAQEIFEKDSESEFVKVEPKLDKKAISKHFKDKKELPFSEIQIEEGETEVRLRRAKV